MVRSRTNNREPVQSKQSARPKDLRVLSARLFGEPVFSVSNTTIDLKTRKARALLTYLCLTGDGKISREVASGLLWSERTEDLARTSLRQTIMIIRRAFNDVGYSGFSASKLDISLEPDLVTTDVQEIIATLDHEDTIPERLLTEHRLSDQLLQSFDSLDEAFLVWLRVRRQTLHDRLCQRLEARLRSNERPGIGEELAAQALIQLDPTHERACRMLMTARGQRGDTTGALDIYERLWHLLDEEYDTEPSQDTQRLVADLKLGLLEITDSASDQDISTTRPDPGHREQSRPGAIAVEARSNAPILVIEPYGGQSNVIPDTHLAAGFRHDLISRLVRFREWTVIEGPVETTPSTRPAYTVMVSVMDYDQSLSATLTVKERQSGAFVWGDTHALSMESIFESQYRIVQRLAMALNIQISVDRMSRVAEHADLSLDLYDRWLRGQELSLQWRPTEEERAETIFRSIIDEQPRFAPAYAGLAQITNSRHIITPGVFRNADTLSESLSLAERARRLDPLDSRAHLCHAWSSALNGNFSDAEAGYVLACDLNENDPWTLVSAAHGLAFCGQPDVAGALAQRSLDFGLPASPLHWSYQVGIWFLCGNPAAAVTAFERADGGYFGVEAWYLAALAELGRIADARHQADSLYSEISSRWAGSDPPSRERAADWLLQCFPIRDGNARARLQRGLAKAGLEAAA